MAPPFSIFIIPMVPFIIYCKSKKLNRVLLIIEFAIIAIAAFIIFISFSIVILPFSYLLILFDKLKKLPQRPFQNKLDIVWRTLDSIIFVFIGIPYLLFWVVLDSINFAHNLFSNDIMPIDQYEMSKKKKENSEESVRKSQVVDEQNKMLKFMSVATKSQASHKSTGKGTNPIKEGLSEMTLSILKACLRNLKNKHQDNIDSFR